MATSISTAVTLSTADVPKRDRQDWLREVIGREYVKVEIRPPSEDSLFNEMTIYPWEDQRLSVIRSNAISIERPSGEPYLASQDAYFAVVLLSGDYSLEQQGREVFLRPGDLTLYDATRPHRIRGPASFSKLIVSIPRRMLNDRIAGIEHCTVLRISGHAGIGAVASNFLRTCASQAGQLSPQEFRALSEHWLDLLTLAVAAVRPEGCNLSRNRSLSLYRVKAFIDRHLSDPSMDAAMVAREVGLSSRHINALFKDEGTSLMRHVWACRLDRCCKDMRDSTKAGRRVSDIAFRWGFSDPSHFSRAFKQRFGCSPLEYRAGERDDS